MAYFVNQRLGQGKVRKLKNLQPVDYLYIPWKCVVQDIADNGGSYHFGPSAAKKEFVKLVAADKAMEKANRKSSACNVMATNDSTESLLTEKQSDQYLISPYEPRSRIAQQMTWPSDSRTSEMLLQINPYAPACSHSSYQSASQASLPIGSYHGLPTLDSSSDTSFMVVPNSGL